MLKNNRKRVFLVSLIVVTIILSFILGLFCSEYTIQKDINLLLNDEVQIIRNSEGSVVYPIKKNNILYVPINGLGSYLSYMTVQNEDGLYLYDRAIENMKLLSGLNTETYDGVKITEEVLKEADYTVFIFWSTNCPNCKTLLEDLKGLNEYTEDKNIQLISVVTNFDSFEDKVEEVSKIQNIENLLDGLNIKYKIYRDKTINENIIKSSISIPKIMIFDENGNMVKTINKDINSNYLKNVLDIICG